MCFGQGSCMVRNRAFPNITQLKGAESYYMKTGTISWISKDWKWNPMVFIGFGLEVEKSEMCVLKAPLSLFLYLSLSPLRSSLPSWSLYCISLFVPDSPSAHFLLSTHNPCFSVILACVELAPALTLNFIIFLFEAHQWLELPDPILGSSPCGMNCLWISCRTLFILVWPVGWDLKKRTCSEEGKDCWRNTSSPRRMWQEAWFLILNCWVWDEKYHRGQIHADWLSSH